MGINFYTSHQETVRQAPRIKQLALVLGQDEYEYIAYTAAFETRRVDDGYEQFNRINVYDDRIEIESHSFCVVLTSKLNLYYYNKSENIKKPHENIAGILAMLLKINMFNPKSYRQIY